MKRRLTALRLDKIAAVDKPCQEHATVAIIKRAPVGPLAIAKATFQEALQANMTADAVNDAFFDSFDGLWERNEAFRTALTDELAAGGDGTTASDDYVASVKALVDEAVAAAREAGSTASDTSAVDGALTKAASSWLASKSKPKEQTMKITTKAELLSAVAKFNPESSPASHITIIQKAAADLGAEDALPAEGLLAKAKPATDPDLVRKVAILEMPADVRKHFDALPEGEQPAFLAKSATERAAIVAKANETDPVLYTTKGGLDIRKSDGAAVLALAKENDGLREDLTKVRGELTGTTLEKRAAAFPNVATSVATDMLKSVDQLGADSAAGKAVMASLTQMNKGASGLFKGIGSTGGDGDSGEPSGDIKKARTDFNQQVVAIAKRDNITRADAMSKARIEHPDLFKTAYPRPEEEAVEEGAE